MSSLSCLCHLMSFCHSCHCVSSLSLSLSQLSPRVITVSLSVTAVTACHHCLSLSVTAVTACHHCLSLSVTAVTACHHCLSLCHSCHRVSSLSLSLSQLSPSVITGLHQIILAIQQYDYQTGLAYHTQMISQGNFSEICSFMPGVKMLLQTAMQLQVYVQ